MISHVFRQPRRQRGATLLVGMIILMLMTVMTITVLKLSRSNAQIVGNMQDRNQAYAAAQGAVEQVISRADFVDAPASVVTTPCTAEANTTCTDVNGDGTNDVKVKVKPTCVSTRIIPQSAPELDFNNTDDQSCLISNKQDYGTVGATDNNSLCARMLWDIEGEATDLRTDAKYTVHQGTTVRVAATTQCPAAPAPAP